MTSHKEARSPRLLTVDEVADYLSMTPTAVRHMVYRRQLPFVRLGPKRLRFDVVEINAWLEDQRVPAAG
jgi:excisionase family DNA binding protein